MVLRLGKGDVQQYFMNYKQNVWNRPERVSGSVARVDDERKLLELWKQEEVDEDYQAVVLRFLDGLNGKAEQHRQIQNELRRTYQRDSNYFRIEKLIQQREKTMTKLEREAQSLERFKMERGQPNLEHICMLIDHLRKVHLLIAEEIHEIFNTYGHPRTTRVGFTYIQLFREFDEDIQFLKESLLKFYIPFSNGFDPFFLELSQRLRKCYTSESLVYDQNVEELINLNASYLYRLLRAQQRTLDAISAADHKDDEPSSPFIIKNRAPANGRNILDSIAEAQPKIKSTEPTERFEQSRLIRQDSRRFSTPKHIENQSQYSYSRSISPIRIKGTAEIGVQKQGPKLQIIRQIITIPKEKERLETQKAQYPGSFKPSPHHSPNRVQEAEYSPTITPRKMKKSQDIEQQQLSEPLRFYRKIQQKAQPSPVTPPQSIYTHKRTHTQGNTMMRKVPKESRLRQFLPKVKASRAKNIENKADCMCRQKYKDKHCEHQLYDISEEELERRRKIIIRKIQMKYKAMAQRQMRHQLSKLGDVTYHRLRNQQHSRHTKVIKTVQTT